MLRSSKRQRLYLLKDEMSIRNLMDPVLPTDPDYFYNLELPLIMMGILLCNDDHRQLLNNRLDRISDQKSISLDVNVETAVGNSPFRQLILDSEKFRETKVCNLIEYIRKLSTEDNIATFTQTNKRERCSENDLPYGFEFEYFCRLELPVIFVMLEPEINSLMSGHFGLILKRVNQVLDAGIIPMGLNLGYMSENIFTSEEWIRMIPDHYKESTILDLTQYLRHKLIERMN